MTPTEILMKHEDANEYHFHEVDRKWIIEAMEEYATISKRETVDKEKSVIPINLYTEEQVREILKSTHIHTDNDVDMILPQFTPIEIPSDEELAILFHNKYEELAPEFKYETRMQTKKFTKDSNNGKLMIAVCKEILQYLTKTNNYGTTNSY